MILNYIFESDQYKVYLLCLLCSGPKQAFQNGIGRYLNMIERIKDPAGTNQSLVFIVWCYTRYGVLLFKFYPYNQRNVKIAACGQIINVKYCFPRL